jgi:hypothetical protein
MQYGQQIFSVGVRCPDIISNEYEISGLYTLLKRYVVSQIAQILRKGSTEEIPSLIPLLSPR